MLTINPDSGPVATSSTPWADLLKSALCSMSARERQAFLASVATGTIPEPSCGAEKAAAVAAEAEPALTKYRGPPRPSAEPYRSRRPPRRDFPFCHFLSAIFLSYRA